MRQRRVDGNQILLAIVTATIVLSPSHFVGVGREVRPGDMMMNADLSAAEAREEALGLVRASFVVAVAVLMIDALRQIAGMQRVPMRRFVGMNG